MRGRQLLENGQEISAIFLTEHFREDEVKERCPNQFYHISAWPAFDRKLCPYCHKVYIRKGG